MNNAPAATRYTYKPHSKYFKLTGDFQIFVSPFVLLFYPVWIIPVTFGLGIYGGFSQVSWYWPNWRKELTDPEKGDLPPDVLSLLILFVQGSSAGCVTSFVSPTAPRTRWSFSRP